MHDATRFRRSATARAPVLRRLLRVPLVVLLLAAGTPVLATKMSQTITFEALANRTYGAAPFTVSASAASGLPVSFISRTTGICTFGGNMVTLLKTGTCTIRASQAGNATYAAAPNVERSFAVTKAEQTIAFRAIADKTMGTAPFAISATASSGLPVSFASLTPIVCTVGGNTVTIVAAGTCTIEASQRGDATYAAAPDVSRSFTVGVTDAIYYTHDGAGNVVRVQRGVLR